MLWVNKLLKHFDVKVFFDYLMIRIGAINSDIEPSNFVSRLFQLAT
jgi:hypothetical protein